VESIPAAPPGSTPESIPVEEVLERVKRTGELVAGTRTDAMPFAYRDADDRWQGYSIDLLERVRSQMQQHLQRPVELKLVPVDSTNRMNMVMAGSVDLVCGATSYSRRRELDVNFSVGYFVTGTQLLINTRSQLGAEFHIGVVAGTTNQSVMAKLFPIAQFSQFENRGNGLAALQRGQIDGLASDGILLQAMRQALPESERLNYQIFPAQQSYDQEKYACILPEGQPEFRKTVNAALMRFMQEAVTGAPQATATLDRWFGEQGVVPIDRQPLLNFFQQQLTAYVPSQPPNWPAFANSTPFDPSLNSTPTQSQAVDRTRDQAANLYTFPIFD
jgi:polar amino acid transport system substrate-binding protein